jgi:hypothetical protein
VTKLAEVDGAVHSTPRNPTPAIRDLLLRIEGEYREMPGLSLTVSQAQRLWGLDKNTCALALTTLVERRVLKQTTVGTFLRGPFG